MNCVRKVACFILLLSNISALCNEEPIKLTYTQRRSKYAREKKEKIATEGIINVWSTNRREGYD